MNTCHSLKAFSRTRTILPDCHSHRIRRSLASNRRQTAAFTLIELLVVVAIIAILAAISIPVIGRALEGAKRAQASQEIAALETALRSYFNEYSRWPHGNNQADRRYPSSDLGDNYELINVLRAVDGTGNNNPAHQNNPRRLVFLEASDDALSPRSGTSEANRNYIDPWERSYVIALDTDFDNAVDTGSFGRLERRTIAIWSWGASGPNNTNDVIKSW